MSLSLLVPILVAAWLAYLVPLAIWVIMQRREPVATLSWLLALAFVPYLGFAVYYLFGPQRIRRRVDRRHRSRREMSEARPEIQRTGGEEERQLVRLAERSTDFPPTTSTEVELLVDGVATYDALLAAVESAEHHVHLEYFIYEPDDIGTRLRDALAAKAEAGVRVRLLVDAYGSGKLNREFLEPLRRAGAEVAFFHETRLLDWLRRPKLNLRTHRKIVVVDGRHALTGGINIEDRHDERKPHGGWHDLHLELRGEVVRHLQIVFLEDWHYTTGVALRDENFWPELEAGPIETHVLPSGPDTVWEPIHRMMVEMFHQAEQRAWLTSPYFVPGEAALFAITSAAMRGVDVRLLLPTEEKLDWKMIAAAARSYYDELLAAGVKIYHYTPRMTHAKAMLVDDAQAVVGSANFDPRSFRLNFELMVRFHDKGFASALAQQMESDFENHCQRVPADRPKGPFRQRFVDSCARLFSPVL